MNKSDGCVHLDEERLLVALVDDGDLSVLEREYLRDCGTCRRERELLTAQLDGLHALSVRHAPILGERKEAASALTRRHPFLWGGSWATAAVTAMLVIGIVLHRPPGQQFNVTADELTAEEESHSLLLAEVSILEENVLPEFYISISCEGADNFDEFYDFLFPFEEESAEA